MQVLKKIVRWIAAGLEFVLKLFVMTPIWMVCSGLYGLGYGLIKGFKTIWVRR